MDDLTHFYGEHSSFITDSSQLASPIKVTLLSIPLFKQIRYIPKQTFCILWKAVNTGMNVFVCLFVCLFGCHKGPHFRLRRLGAELKYSKYWLYRTKLGQLERRLRVLYFHLRSVGSKAPRACRVSSPVCPSKTRRTRTSLSP